MYDMRKEIFEHLQRLPMSFFDRSPVGRLVTRATTDVDALNDLFASGVVAMLNDFVLLFGARRGFLSVATAGSALATFRRCRLWFCSLISSATTCATRNRSIRTAIARINAFLQEHISGMAVVQLFNRERKIARAVRRIEPDSHGSVQGRDRRVLAFFIRRSSFSAWAALRCCTGSAACA